MLVCEFSGRCRWFKLPAGTPDGEWDLGEPPGDGRHTVWGISADGSAVAYTGPAVRGRQFQAPAVLDGKTGRPLLIFKDGVYFSEVSISADGRRAAVMLDGKERVAGTTLFGVVDVASGATLGQVRVATGIVVPPFALAPDGKALVVLDRSGAKLHLFDVPAPKGP